jgi:hypothetical protein
MKRLTAVALVALAVVGLAGCSRIDSGEIRDKSYSPPSSYTVYDCYTRSPQGMCTFQVPRQVPVPASYSFDLYADEETHNWHGVDEQTYHSYEVGDWYNE